MLIDKNMGMKGFNSMFYAIIFTTFIALYYLLKVIFVKKTIGDIVNHEKLNKIYCVLVTIILILLSGLRSYQMGQDPKTYKFLFEYFKQFSVKEIILMNHTEKGYVILENIIGGIFGGFQWHMIIIAIIYTVPIAILVKRYSQNPWISFFVFLGFGFFTDSLTALRQTVAVGLTVLAFLCIRNKKLIKYFILVFIASTFHIDALAFIPIYWFRKVKFNNKIIIASIITITASYIFKSHLYKFVNLFSRQVYEVNPNTGGDRLFIFIILTVILSFIYGKAMIKENEYNKMIIYMMIITAIIYPVLSFNPAVYRMNWYFFIYLIIFIPNLLGVIKDKVVYFIIFIGYIGMSIYFLYAVSLRPDSLMSPFLFFWQ